MNALIEKLRKFLIVFVLKAFDEAFICKAVVCPLAYDDVVKDLDVDDDAFRHIEALIQSMTPHERSNPDQINGSRRRRIAKGAGMEVQDVNGLLKQFREMKKLMKTMAKLQGKGRSIDPTQLLGR